MDIKLLCHELVGHLPVSEVDIFRLFVEFAEEAGLVDMDRRAFIDTYRRVIRAGISAIRMAEYTVTFGEAVQASLASRSHRRPSTIADLRSFTGRMMRYGHWADLPLRNITLRQCRAMLEEVFGHSPYVFRKGKTILNSIFAYGKRQGWCTYNPVDSIESPPVFEERIDILSISQIRALVRACEAPDLREMDAAMRLMLWCGIRPGEVRRLRWRDIDVEEGVVYIDAQNSKTGGARVVPLRGGALRLCSCVPQQKPDSYIAPRNWNRLWVRLRSRAGLRKWQRDALRHTFASMNLKRFHNLPMLQEEMGHRDSYLLRTRYLNMRNLTSAAARLFFKF